MSYGRRTTDRRRRVQYSSRNAENETVTAASRRAALRLREARSPLTPYGSRVQHGLRGRWFSIVPVRRRALMLWCLVVGSIVGVLCAAHYASVTWPSIAYRPEIARALRLDRPDSFGRWVTSALLAGCAGISVLIYQLRRHKNDDYRGHYRLWRLVLVVMLLASIDSVASVVDWSGALLDAGFGKRVALSGNDWLRIVLSIGGAVLALQLSVEVRRSKWALATILVAWCVLAFPIAARWNFFTIDSIGRWTLVTSAPILASAMLFVSLGGYLRMLYREVRNITDDRTIGQRVTELKLRVFAASEDDVAPEPKVARREPIRERAPVAKEDMPKRGWFGREREARAVDEPKAGQVVSKQQAEVDGDSADKTPTEPSEKRGWFGRRKQNTADIESETDRDEQSPATEKKRGLFSLRLQPTASSQATDDQDADEPDFQVAEQNEASDSKPKKRFGLGGWMKSGNAKTDESSDDANESDSTNRVRSSDHSANDDDGDVDLDGIDWSGMSKAERRRLRKKLKRDGRAA